MRPSVQVIKVIAQGSRTAIVSPGRFSGFWSIKEMVSLYWRQAEQCTRQRKMLSVCSRQLFSNQGACQDGDWDRRCPAWYCNSGPSSRCNWQLGLLGTKPPIAHMGELMIPVYQTTFRIKASYWCRILHIARPDSDWTYLQVYISLAGSGASTSISEPNLYFQISSNERNLQAQDSQGITLVEPKFETRQADYFQEIGSFQRWFAT